MFRKNTPFYDLDIIKVLVGSRRAGKSKVLELIINELKERGVDEQDILYMNFENLDFEEISDYKKLNTYEKEHKGKNKQYLFFFFFNMYQDVRERRFRLCEFEVWVFRLIRLGAFFFFFFPKAGFCGNLFSIP